MTLQITNNGPSDDDDNLPVEEPSLDCDLEWSAPAPFVQLCFRRKKDASDQVYLCPIIMYTDDFASEPQERLQQLLDSDETSLLDTDDYSRFGEILREIAESSSSCSSSCISGVCEEKEAWSHCSSDVETLSTAGTEELWWNFETVDWNKPSFNKSPHNYNRQSNEKDINIWYFGVPNHPLEDFGTVVLLDSPFHFDDSPMCSGMDPVTCGRWLLRVVPQKRRLRNHLVSSPEQATFSTQTPRRSYSVLHGQEVEP